MKPSQAIIKSIIALLLFTCLTYSAYSQRLNNTQEGSVWAPANVKVDAKSTEWNDTFQANNKTTDIFYTIANDGKNLYLIIKSTDQMINNKIIAGGITITINTSGKKKDKDGFEITFPLVNMENLRGQVMARMRGPGGPGPLDSAAIAGMRKQAVAAAKEIKLIGFKEIPDSVVSIYNEYGVKAALDYDRNGSMISEMAIPLKLLGLSVDSKEFAYNIKLNGLNLSALFPGAVAMFAGGPPGGGGFNRPPGGGGGGFGGPPPGGAGFGGGDVVRTAPGMPSMQDMQNIISPTDFWGKYTMAKK
jgi:hypothetical protein